MTVEEVVAIAKKMLFELGELRPTIIIEATKGSRLVPLGNLPELEEPKLKLMLMLGYRAAQDKELGELTHVFFLSEGWASKAPQRVSLRVMPSDDPNRVEVVMVASHTRAEGVTGIVLFEVARSAGNDEVELTRVQESDLAHSPLLDAFLYGYEQGLQAA